MNERKGKIFGLLIFILLIGVLCYLTFYSNSIQRNGRIEQIHVEGNKLLPGNDYISFARLNNISLLKGLTLGIIKDRFEKHPYILRADVEYTGKNEVNIHLTEKGIYAVVLNGSQPYLISDKFQLLPLLANMKFVDYPVITNLKENRLKSLSVVQSDDLVQAFKIIDAVRLTDTEILKRLSEINLRSGGDVVMTLSGIQPPIIFGRGREAEKMVCIEMLWSNLFEGKNLLIESDYVDLRFADNIYLGNIVRRAPSEENQD